ncbi:DUF2164 domain-containing protein [Lentibacillus sp. L22]|uniref:DUF2164 domain-containing protein n=1 Tax=Lentibacillus TaxID=175304 RepID=UPI0022B1438E|nr:DUF2164 domain-containing protein [Lentibacillus daqui]
MKSKFTLTKEQKEELTGLIKGYFSKERDEEIGDLAAMLLLEFFMDELAPIFYNMAVEDCHAFMSGKLDDLFEIQK